MNIQELLIPFVPSDPNKDCIEGFERRAFLDTISHIIRNHSGRAVRKDSLWPSTLMILHRLRIIIISFFGTCFNLNAVVMTISDSGLYKLSGNVSGSTIESIINITTSDVELDLNGYVVSQSNSNGNGIVINEGLSNIIVRNGMVCGTVGTTETGSGVVVNTTTSSCSKIILDDLIMEQWRSKGIYFQGASSSIRVTDSQIKNYRITRSLASESCTCSFLLLCAYCYV